MLGQDREVGSEVVGEAGSSPELMNLEPTHECPFLAAVQGAFELPVPLSIHPTPTTDLFGARHECF